VSIVASIISQFDDRGFREAQGAVTKSESKFKKFGKTAGVALAAGFAVAAAAAVKLGADSIRAGEAASTANSRITQVAESMGLFGKEAGAVSERLQKLAEQTARNTGVDTNAIKATQAKLLTFKELAATADEVGGQFDRATAAAIDLAAAGFGSAEGNAAQLGKALNDPIKGLTSLTKSGVTFTEAERERIKVLVESNRIGEAQEQILGAIETQVGGVAEATANTTDKLRVGFEQLLAKVGTPLLSILDKVAAVVFDKVFPAFEKLGEKIGPTLEKIFPKVKKFGDVFMRDVIPALKTVYAVIKDQVLPLLVSVFRPVWDGLVSAFNTVKDAIVANKDELILIGKVIAGVAAVALKILGDRKSVV